MLSIPLVLTGLLQSSMSFFENIFLAHLGPHVLAAGALVAWLFWTLISIIFGAFSSVNILVAHKHGAKDIEGISHVLRDGLILAILLAIPTFLLIWNIAPLFKLFGQSPALVALAMTYLHALAWGLFPKFILIVFYEMLIGLGHARVITIFTMLTIPLYILFSYTLIFGKLGLPMLGIAGAGWGMTIGDWFSAICLCLYVFLNKQYRCYLISIFNFKTHSYLCEMLKLGMPVGAMYGVEVCFFFAVTLLMGLISIQTLAANQVTMQFLGPLIGIIFSIAQAMTVRMGHELGANHPEEASRAGYAGMVVVTIFMSIVAIFYWLIPEVLIAIDFNIHIPQNFKTIQYAKEFMFIAAFFQLFESIRIAMFGALRGLKDTRFPLLASVISYWCIALPIGYVLSIYLKLGGIGFWYGMVVGAVFSSTLLFKRFKSKIHGYLH